MVGIFVVRSVLYVGPEKFTISKQIAFLMIWKRPKYRNFNFSFCFLNRTDNYDNIVNCKTFCEKLIEILFLLMISQNIKIWDLAIFYNFLKSSGTIHPFMIIHAFFSFFVHSKDVWFCSIVKVFRNHWSFSTRLKTVQSSDRKYNFSAQNSYAFRRLHPNKASVKW
jgi:hypothetical protein